MPILRPCLVLFSCLVLLTGVAYPLVITGLAQLLFPDQADGSLIRDGGRITGSRLIAQPVTAQDLFWPRPSAMAWNASGSGGANLAPVSAPQRKIWSDQVQALRAAGVTGTLPADLVTASGSGLDPHLSPAAVLAQVPRVAAARGMVEGPLRELIAARTEAPQCGLLGAARVNVLELNRALVKITSGAR